MNPLISHYGTDTAPSLLCRAAFDAPTVVAGEVMYMPAGVQTITPSQAGRSVRVKVQVDRAAAVALEKQRAALEAKGKRAYFDFNHEDGEASFWPEEFYWKDGTGGNRGNGGSVFASASEVAAHGTSGGRKTAELSSVSSCSQAGIYARGEWSDLGRQAIAGKRYRQFSPVFYVDDVRANPAHITAREDARPNMGGLVNDPAFHTILPFWAKDAGATGGLNQPGLRPTPANTMNEYTLATLRAKIQSLEQEVHALEGRDSDEITGDLRMRQAELQAAQSELAAGEAKREAESLRSTNIALEATDKARREGEARAAVQTAVARGVIAARDESTQRTWEALICADPSHVSLLDRIPGHGALQARFAPSISVTGSDPRHVLGTLSALAARQSRAHPHERGQLSREFGALYASEFRGDNGRRILDAPLCAADSTDTNLGTLAGTLVTQRTLELLRLQFPVLTRVTTDFSEQPAQFSQTIVSRIITIPSASDYNTSTGWSDSAAATTDVPVTINKHKGVPITFNANILASTVRRLFEEFAPASSYALAKAMVDDIYANVTDANFTNNTVNATSTFARANVIDIGTQLTLRGVPQGDMNRTMLLYPTVFAKLAQDSSLVTFAAFQRPDLFERDSDNTAFAFPVHGFSVNEAANLPTNNGNITGFAFSKSALVLASRVPNDYTSVLPGASYGNVQVVTDPDLGISVMLVQYVNHQLGSATQRIALMYGTAAGQGSAGQLLKAASGTGSSRS